MLRSFLSSTSTRQTIQRTIKKTNNNNSFSRSIITSTSLLSTTRHSTVRPPIFYTPTRSTLSQRQSLIKSDLVKTDRRQQQLRTRCTCAHHNQISMSLDGVDKSMGVITGGVAEMAGERDAYRLPTEGESFESGVQRGSFVVEIELMCLMDGRSI